MMVDVPKKISELPPAQLANDTDYYPVVQLADTRKQTLAQLRVAIGLGANVVAFNGLTGAADKLAYFTGVGAMALATFTAQARAFTAAATLGAQQTALGLVPQTSASDFTVGRVMLVGGLGLGAPIPLTSTDLNTVTTGKEYFVTTPTNGPTANNGWLSVLPQSGTFCAQRFVDSTTGLIYERTLLSSVWGAWAARAKSGANSDITALTGLTTPLSIAQGGTGLAAQTMTALPLNNSWVVYTSRRAVYRKVADNVQLEVAIRNGTATDGTVVATLPAGFRPPSLLVVPVAAYATATPSTTATVPAVIINTDGTIACLNCNNALLSFSVVFSLV